MAKRAKGWGYRTGTRKDVERAESAARKRAKSKRGQFRILSTQERREERSPKGQLRKPHASSNIVD